MPKYMDQLKLRDKEEIRKDVSLTEEGFEREAKYTLRLELIKNSDYAREEGFLEKADKYLELRDKLDMPVGDPDARKEMDELLQDGDFHQKIARINQLVDSSFQVLKADREKENIPYGGPKEPAQNGKERNMDKVMRRDIDDIVKDKDITREEFEREVKNVTRYEYIKQQDEAFQDKADEYLTCKSRIEEGGENAAQYQARLDELQKDAAFMEKMNDIERIAGVNLEDQLYHREHDEKLPFAEKAPEQKPQRRFAAPGSVHAPKPKDRIEELRNDHTMEEEKWLDEMYKGIEESVMKKYDLKQYENEMKELAEKTKKLEEDKEHEAQNKQELEETKKKLTELVKKVGQEQKKAEQEIENAYSEELKKRREELEKRKENQKKEQNKEADKGQQKKEADKEANKEANKAQPQNKEAQKPDDSIDKSKQGEAKPGKKLKDPQVVGEEADKKKGAETLEDAIIGFAKWMTMGYVELIATALGLDVLRDKLLGRSGNKLTPLKEVGSIEKDTGARYHVPDKPKYRKKADNDGIYKEAEQQKEKEAEEAGKKNPGDAGNQQGIDEKADQQAQKANEEVKQENAAEDAKAKEELERIKAQNAARKKGKQEEKKEEQLKEEQPKGEQPKEEQPKEEQPKEEQPKQEEQPKADEPEEDEMDISELPLVKQASVLDALYQKLQGSGKTHINSGKFNGMMDALGEVHDLMHNKMDTLMRDFGNSPEFQKLFEGPDGPMYLAFNQAFENVQKKATGYVNEVTNNGTKTHAGSGLGNSRLKDSLDVIKTIDENEAARLGQNIMIDVKDGKASRRVDYNTLVDITFDEKKYNNKKELEKKLGAERRQQERDRKEQQKKQDDMLNSGQKSNSAFVPKTK